MSDDNSRVIISRIQNRRGLKQDLPQPLRPGELGFAVDSRQLYIGGDADHPNAAQYSNLSYFENTVNAREHGIAIANNNIIAFTVPFIKYSKGEFTGTNSTKEWFPTDARSIIDPVDKPECTHMGYNKPVFSTVVTNPVESTVSVGTTGSATIFVTNTGGLDPTGNIRTGDKVTGDDITAAQNVLVQNAQADPGTGEYTITLNKEVNTTTLANITFTPNAIKNFLTNETFKSGEVLVYKNGLKLVGDPDTDVLEVPGAAYDYVLNASNTAIDSAHTLSLRTRPVSSDDVSICYYDASAVKQAIKGVGSEGKISSSIDTDSFYAAYNISDYRKLDEENIVVSETTGLGYIGLEQKHIVAVADSTANVATPTAVSLGNLIITRDDIQWDSNTTVANAVNPDSQWDLELDPEESLVLSPAGDGGTYRYNRLRLKSTNDETLYFHDEVFDVLSADSGGTVTIAVPVREFALYRTADADLASVTRYGASNGYRVNITGITQDSPAVVSTDRDHNFSQGDRITLTDVGGMTEVDGLTFYINNVAPGDSFTLYSDAGLSIPVDSTAFTAYTTGGVARQEITDNTYVTIKGNTEGVRAEDWVRIFDGGGDTAYNPLHDYVFQVRAVRDSEFDLLIDTPYVNGGVLPSFTENIANVNYVNHGQDVANITTYFQVDSLDHGLKTSLNNVTIVNGDVAGMFVDTNTYTISQLPQDITNNTFFITDYAGALPPATENWDIDGVEFRPTLENSYTNIVATPALSIDLRESTTLADALATVNKNLVVTKAGTDPEEVFPIMEYMPQTDGSLNRVYITQDPAYTSIDVGGLPFSLYEDYDNATLSELNIPAGEYDRNTNTVKAKLEQWMNSVVADRDLNLFSEVMLLGNSYTEAGNVTNLGTYSLQIDDTFDDVTFCSRDEARNFNGLVNKAYSESPFDRAEDDRDGTRGIINIKNNLEITTLEQSGVGTKVTTFPTMEAGFILRGAAPDTEVFRISLSVYDSFILEYSISETGGSAIDKYSRVGTMHIVARTDFTDPNNAVSIIDNFSSTYERNSVSPDAVVEPRFDGRIVDGNIVVELVTQYRDPLNPIGGDEVGHTLDCDLKLRYLQRRWTSTD